MTVDEMMQVEEQRLAREMAHERWESWRDAVLHNGGVALSHRDREDYRELPLCLRRRSGLSIDLMAAQFDFSYPDDFVAAVVSAYDRYCATQRVARLPRHWDNPTLQRLLDGYYEIWRECVRLGYLSRHKGDPAVQSVYAVQRAARTEYKQACRAADVVPAAI